MEIWNHFTFREDLHPMLSRYVKNNGIKYEGGDILCAVDISENDPRWKTVEQLLKAEKNSFRSETKFTKPELLNAEWLTLRSQWYYDYPQPENGYTNITYTDEYRCNHSDCNIGRVQKDCFRFKRTPKWGRRNFCMTNWVYDELFVSSKAKEMLDSSGLKGFDYLEVKNKSGKETLNDVYQMKISFVIPEAIIDSSGYIREIFDCPLCGKQKFLLSGRGQLVLNRKALEGALDFVKSAEYFGSGGIASKLIFVSQDVYRFITENKLDSSLVFEPVKLV